MKKVIFTLLLSGMILTGFSQSTYYWVGGTTPAAGGWSTGANWNTALAGNGTARTTAAATDILIFDGTNIGGSTPTTGAVAVSLTSQTIGKLVLQNNADVALSRNGSGGTTTLTIGDNPSGDDLVVFSGCTLRLKGSTGSLLVALASDAGASNSPPATTSATALINGNIVLEEGSSTIQNRFTSKFKGAFVFAANSSLRTLAAYQYYPFGTSGSSATPVNDGVIFENGAVYYYEGGLSPFGSNSTSFLVKFKQGSVFYFRAAPATNMFSSRKYGDVIVENNATVTADGSLVGIDNLTVQSGATFITNTTGVTPILGNIQVNGTLRVPAANPDRDNKILIAGATSQSLSGTGTVSLADLIISNNTSLNLQKGIAVDTITRIIGSLTYNGNTISGASTISPKPTASVSPTGTMNVDSFLVKNINDFTGIEAGMSVTGTNIPAGTVVINTSSTAGTITLSKPVTGTVTYASAAATLTIFNGQGTIVPVKLYNLSAIDQQGKVKIQWNTEAEINVDSYTIERATDGINFSAINNLLATGNKQYSSIDNSPVSVNYYRIKVINKNGISEYSAIVKVKLNNTKAEISVYPNPVKGNMVSLQLTNLAKGRTEIKLYNYLGQQIMATTVNYESGSQLHNLVLPATIAKGMYKLVVTNDNKNLQQSILVD